MISIRGQEPAREHLREDITLPRFRSLKQLAALAAHLPFATTSGPARTTGRPYTIPALKTWHDANETYTFSTQARIVLHQAQLPEIGAVFAHDLQLLPGLG